MFYSYSSAIYLPSLVEHMRLPAHYIYSILGKIMIHNLLKFYFLQNNFLTMSFQFTNMFYNHSDNDSIEDDVSIEVDLYER